MDFKFGTIKEEIWRNQTMCGFQKPKLCFRQRQLSSPAHGIDIADGFGF